MWPLRFMRPSHWVLLTLVVLFLCIYLGLLSWGRVQDSLESLAAYKSGAQVFQAKVDRADSIFIVFMFLMLTPLLVAALGTTIALVGAVLAGFLESLVRTPATQAGMPDARPAGLDVHGRRLSGARPGHVLLARAVAPGVPGLPLPHRPGDPRGVPVALACRAGAWAWSSAAAAPRFF